jgi:hypothetical protein
LQFDETPAFGKHEPCYLCILFSVFNASWKLKIVATDDREAETEEMLSDSELRHLSEQCPVSSSRTAKMQFAMQTTAFTQAAVLGT